MIIFRFSIHFNFIPKFIISKKKLYYIQKSICLQYKKVGIHFTFQGLYGIDGTSKIK
jgi:hypothetical protein